ncbi:MAG: Rpn family recombination-promoting nuclease/putative transposase, partial [Bacteroidota bacterium]
GTITDLSYAKNEQLGATGSDRKAIFDRPATRLYCTNQEGERFIVEIQKTKQAFFKERALYYSTFPIQEQAQTGNWKFELKAVYTIGILDRPATRFAFDEDQDDNKIRHEVKLTDVETKEIFYDKFTFIYLTMTRFDKKLKELETKFDKWLYVIKNLHKLDRLPDELREGVFEKVFERSEIAKLSREELMDYENSLKVYRDLNNVIDYSYDKGREEGREEEKKNSELEKRKIVENMIKLGFDNPTISKATELDEHEIEKIRQMINKN